MLDYICSTINDKRLQKVTPTTTRPVKIQEILKRFPDSMVENP